MGKMQIKGGKRLKKEGGRLMSKIIYKACRWTEKGVNKKGEVGLKILSAI